MGQSKAALKTHMTLLEFMKQVTEAKINAVLQVKVHTPNGVRTCAVTGVKCSNDKKTVTIETDCFVGSTKHEAITNTEANSRWVEVKQ